jgi:hypothetical protein
MTDEDKITLTREQWGAFVKNRPGLKSHFDDLKAHVKKKERREWRHVREIYTREINDDGISSCGLGGLGGIHVREVFEGDILKTKEEARNWLRRGMEVLPNTVFDHVGNTLFNKYMEALGLGEGRSE